MSDVSDRLLRDPDVEDDIQFFEDHLESKCYVELPPEIEFHSSFPRAGKQGILGVFTNTETGRKYVYKISQYLNFLVEQEFSVMQGLNQLRSFCPHFCQTLGIFQTRITDNFRFEDNPFEYDKRSIMTSVLLMQHIEDARKLYRYVKNDNVPIDVLMSQVKQTLLATMIASEHGRFTHYDLHSNNVLVKKCPTNSVFLYILDANRVYLVPTYGYMPVIIDFGFSYHMNCNQRPMFGALAHTDIGFVPAIHDHQADAKLFLTSVSWELNKYKPSEESKTFRKLVTSIYGDCSVDLECGWDEYEEDDPLNESISDVLLNKLNSQFKRSKFFKSQGHHVVDLLQALLILPLRARKTDDTLDDLAGILVTEFGKLEREIGTDFYNLYLFKIIIDSVIRHREAYLSPELREQAVMQFKSDVLKELDRVAKFCQPKINWEKLLCCLLCLSKCIENLCYDRLKKLISHKKSNFNKMMVRSPTEVFEAIDANLPSHFFFNRQTTVYVWDAHNQQSGKFTIPEEWVDDLNETHPFERGLYLYEKMSDEMRD